jgi:histidinol dehydrogenase
VAVNLTPEHLAAIEQEVDQQAHALERVDIVRQSIKKSVTVKVATPDEAIAFSNDYAPEHLIIHLENARDKVAQIDNAGSIFVGPYTPERSVACWKIRENFTYHASVAVIMPRALTIRSQRTGMPGSSAE